MLLLDLSLVMTTQLAGEVIITTTSTIIITTITTTTTIGVYPIADLREMEGLKLGLKDPVVIIITAVVVIFLLFLLL